MKKKTRQIRRTLILKLNLADKSRLKKLLSGGRESVRAIKRAQVLLHLNNGMSPPAAGRAVGVTPETARSVGWKYIDQGLDRALCELPRPGNQRRLDQKQSQKIIAMVCSEPPKGRSRWTVRLITEESKKRGIVDDVGKSTIHELLKNHDLKPWREKNVVCV